MTDNELLIERIRRILSQRENYSERKMFGSVCFMINGNMCAGTWNGSLIVRLDKKDHDATLAEPYTAPADMNGRILKGWALIEPAGISTDEQLAEWLDRAVGFASFLSPKSQSRKSQRKATRRGTNL